MPKLVKRKFDCCLFVSGFDTNCTHEELEMAFAQYGALRKVWMDFNSNEGFAMVTYHEAKDARTATEEMDGKKLAGRQIRVEQDRTKIFI